MNFSFVKTRRVKCVNEFVKCIALLLLLSPISTVAQTDTKLDCAQRLEALTATSVTAADLPCTSLEKNLPADAKLQSRIGEIYQFGKGIPADNLAAFQWYMKAAQQGYVDAENRVGLLYSDGLGVPQDYAKALEWFRKAADAGSGFAEGNIGVMYEHGWGVPKDAKQAVEWELKAVSHGFSAPAYNLGLAYHNGAGVPQDYKKAAEWFRKGAEGGDAKAQFVLGDYYVEGRGVARDYFEAGKWLDLAARQGFQQAKDYLAKIHNLCLPQSAPDKNDPSSCEMDAMTGNARAKVIVASFYARGTFLPKDLTAAAQWYRKAAVQRDPLAHMMLARMYDKGEGVPIDEAEAYAWVSVVEQEKTAEQDRSVVEPFKTLIPKLKPAIASKMDAETMKQAQARADEYVEKYSAK
jgi:TPR repeat protein